MVSALVDGRNVNQPKVGVVGHWPPVGRAVGTGVMSSSSGLTLTPGASTGLPVSRSILSAHVALAYFSALGAHQ